MNLTGRQQCEEDTLDEVVSLSMHVIEPAADEDVNLLPLACHQIESQIKTTGIPFTSQVFIHLGRVL
ncbi:MAG: hypothetical protein M3R69_04955 [Acidobacteriota bacterium]|nr:hypothetical protein [Acidobacteriota bacterium]